MIVRNYRDLKEWKEAAKDRGFTTECTKTPVNNHHEAITKDGKFGGFFNTRAKIGQLTVKSKGQSK